MTFIEQPHYFEDDPPEELFVFFLIFILNDFIVDFVLCVFCYIFIEKEFLS